MTMTKRQPPANHEAIINQPPIPYRGYLIKVVDFSRSPRLTDGGKVAFHGYNVCDAESGMVNKAPGACYSPTIGGAKTMIDALYESGGHNAPMDDHSWVPAFYRLCRERSQGES